MPTVFLTQEKRFTVIGKAFCSFISAFEVWHLKTNQFLYSAKNF